MFMLSRVDSKDPDQTVMIHLLVCVLTILGNRQTAVLLDLA